MVTEARPELQSANEALQAETNKTEKLQRYLKHAEEDVEKLTNQLDEQKDQLANMESEKGQTFRQLTAARAGEISCTCRRDSPC